MYERKYHSGELSSKTFLVTGGAGFIGSNLVQYLLRHNAGKVRVLDNLITGSFDNIKDFQNNPAFEFFEGDTRDIEVCREACQDIDYVLHQAALGSVPRSLDEPHLTNSINVDGLVNMLTAAKETGIKRFVYASSSSVYGDNKDLPQTENKIGKQLSPYAVSKYVNELYANVFHDNFGLEVIGLRYFNVFGPKQSPEGEYAAVIPLFVDGILNNKEVFINGDGEQTRDFTFVENAVQANIKALFTENPKAVSRVFNVAVGENFSVNYLFQSIREYLQSDKSPTYRQARKGEIRDSLADISSAQNILGYQPLIKFQDGLHQTIEYFKEKILVSK